MNDDNKEAELTQAVRIQKFLSQAGFCSRRKAEELIKAGKVKVNGKIITELGAKILPDKQTVLVNDIDIKGVQKRTYVILNKPTGYLTTLHDPFSRKTILDLLPKDLPRLFPVGRLDLDSEGLLLLTDDGELTKRLLHPSFKVAKTYRCLVKPPPTYEQLERLRQGIVVKELGERKTMPCTIKTLSKHANNAMVEITLKEGRKRQIRLMFKAVGCEVLRLIRVKMGSLELKELPKGTFRELTEKEVLRLKKEAGL